MKKTFSLFLIGLLFSLVLTSCDDRTEYVDEDTYSAVYDLKNLNLNYNSSTGIATYSTNFKRDLYNSDIVLIYRQVGTVNNNPVWQVLPQTIYNIEAGNLVGQELDYTFDFSKQDFAIYASGTFDLRLRPDFITNQNFRIVLVPGYFGKSTNNTDINPRKLSYEEVIKKYNIDDSKVKSL